MSKEKIAIDINEVLFPFIDEFIKDHNTRFATSLNKSQFNTYEFSGPLINQWLVKYHNYRPHQSLNYLTPNEFKARIQDTEVALR